MRKLVVLFVLLISCPRPQVEIMPMSHRQTEIERTYRQNPLRALRIIDGLITAGQGKDFAEALLAVYIDQREYRKAERLLDSLGWQVAMTRPERIRLLVKLGRWEQVRAEGDNQLLQAVASINCQDYGRAVELLAKTAGPADFTALCRALAFYKIGEKDSAFAGLMAISTVSTYLEDRYQNLLFELLVDIGDTERIAKELDKLRDQSLRDYALLKIYEKNNKPKASEIAWRLMRKYPRSSGARYALALVKPATRSEYRHCARVEYYGGDYDQAINHYGKVAVDDEAAYHLGKIFYDRNQYDNARQMLRKSAWPEAYYYRARIHEEKNEFHEAIALYDSLYQRDSKSRFGIRALKRKAFLLEDLGDTMSAVQTFLKIHERSTRFRAAMQLYRMGRLDEMLNILEEGSEPANLYWQIRARERLNRPTDSLREALFRTYPLSYYSLLRSAQTLSIDSTTLATWVRQLGDTVVTFDYEDSVHIKTAAAYFEINEPAYAEAELDMIEETSAIDLIGLVDMCRRYGADRPAIDYCLKLKKIAEKRQVNAFPREFLQLLYPVRFAFSIMEQGSDPLLLLAMVWQESLFDPNAHSKADAQGLMQIIPATGRLIARSFALGSYSLYDAETSISFGNRYLIQMKDNFASVPLALAAYNAGPVVVKRWLKKDPNAELDEFIELIPYSETQDYVKLVLARQLIYRSLYGDFSGSGTD